MDNPSRSERSRNAALDAAITIVTRDGPGRLTLDAIARESGLSKGGVMHQFRTKEAVLRALLEQQMAHFEEFSNRYIEKVRGTTDQPELSAQIATLREAISTPRAGAFALLAAMNENPELMAMPRDADIKKVALMKAEARDPDLALLRWAAARGLLLSSLFGMLSLTEAERDRLFERLLDNSKWTAMEQGATEATKPSRATAAHAASPRPAGAPAPKPASARKRG
ncbi:MULTISPECIES: TetR/AcrR family transcriptional regulator [Bradyrhizobium]|jgi:AcrR family transcriptional regulator|uniref:TetR/AcrR family transcriptional regulator n=1 Tax=Bradyrhizobium TaxID=374 RepID=UPI000484F85E|nr:MULTISPECIES: TetR/AcrR family transcriptional regulator [Bradyrhizobium]MCS3448939.1 AcrR family transcriptional regulator [Bradyrhizobium elkanii]MCS3559918.1 AcrR family transcriptional regulator [Bradyrhizobium elkanii]MCW2150236.1 AcrR family transcriptional regulator [Bradyrhizobium elkanii]MCW2359706.1 AcrR family transcriptional regulator [Bradyrhizobium elkanii]MCW2373967.1 AcrR family transcriptional regulator [Bradyrhizobium elkanii]